MLISEMIETLSDFLEESGDLNVCHLTTKDGKPAVKIAKIGMGLMDEDRKKGVLLIGTTEIFDFLKTERLDETIN